MYQLIHATLRQLTVITLLMLLIFNPIAHAGETIASGQWQKFKANTKGNWHISVHEGKRFIHFDDEFKTKKAPDLKVVLSPKPLQDVTNRSALEGSVIISLLTNYSGAQRFEIPADIDLSKYQSLLIHCEKYTYVWSGGKL